MAASLDQDAITRTSHSRGLELGQANRRVYDVRWRDDDHNQGNWTVGLVSPAGQRVRGAVISSRNARIMSRPALESGLLPFPNYGWERESLYMLGSVLEYNVLAF